MLVEEEAMSLHMYVLNLAISGDRFHVDIQYMQGSVTLYTLGVA